MIENTEIKPRPFAERVAYKILALTTELQAARDNNAVLFRIYPLPDRLVVSFETDFIDLGRVGEKFAHFLSTRLGGRTVVITNTRGLYFQIGYDVPATRIFNTTPQPLDFSQQPTPYHVPIGNTETGPLWISLPSANGIFVAGSPGQGKSGAVHGMIQALLYGGQVEIYADDGGAAVEYGRYADNPRFYYMVNVRKNLDTLSNLLASRWEKMRPTGHTQILSYNANYAKTDAEKLPLIVLVVDEVTLLDDDVKGQIKRMAQLYRKCGLYPIIATNEPQKAAFAGKSFLPTRICFKVPQHHDSAVALGYAGAEKLPTTAEGQPGQGLIVWNGSLVKFQAFRVPGIGVDAELTDSQKHALDDLFANEAPETTQTPRSEIIELAESIRDKWRPGMNGSAVAELFGKTYGGGWYPKIKKIIEYLSSTSAESRSTGNFGAVEE